MGTIAKTGGASGFFSSLVDSVGTGLNKVGSDVLPIWAANQLGVQSRNQLNQDTINQKLQAPTTASIGPVDFISQNKSKLILVGIGVAGVIIAVILKRKR